MKVVLDEIFWDEKRHFHPNLDESVPNRWDTLAGDYLPQPANLRRCSQKKACVQTCKTIVPMYI